MRQIYPISDDKPKKIKYILILLAFVLAGGVASLFINGGGKSKKNQEEKFEFVEFTPPPPPPPPPVPDEPETEPEPTEEIIEPLDIPQEAEVPNDEPVSNTAIDISDLAAGIGGDGDSNFIINPGVGRRGRGSSGGDDEDEFGGASDSIEPASPTLKTQPIYPSSLLKNKIGGKVVIAAVVDAAGVVIRCTIKTSSGQPELDKSALTAVQKWKFKPGTRDGKAVKSTCLIPYTFKVEKS